MRILVIIFYVLLIPIFFACEKTPEYPNIPQITFTKIERFTVLNQYTKAPLDSINIVINFKDGDGDLGLSDQDQQSPYEPYSFVYDQNGELILIGSSDTLPPYSNCHYVKGEFVDSHVGEDIVLVTPNLNYFNYFAELWVKDGGEFEKVELNLCPSPFNGRYPILSPDNYEGPLDGTLTFTINDPGIRSHVEGKTAKFKVYIKDRALNTSNVIETSEIHFSY